VGHGERAVNAGRAASRPRTRFDFLPTLTVLAAILRCGPCAAATESWVSEYPRVAAKAEHDCARPELRDCRTELLRLAALLDNRVDFLYRLAKVEARLGHVESSLGYLKSYAQSQLDFGDPDAQPEFHTLRANPRFQQLEQIYRAGLGATGTHRQLAVAPDTDLVAEDLTVDGRTGTRYLSSVHLGRVLALDATGHWSDFAGPPALAAWGIYALAADAAHARLWISTVAGAVSPPFRAADQGRSAVLRINLDSGHPEQRYELKDGRSHAFGDFALGAKGELYVSDGVGGGLYGIGPENGAILRVIIEPGAMRSPQTPVPLPDGTHVLVADYSRGIAIVNLHHRSGVSWLRHAPELAVYGIDGLYLHGQTLIAIQNGTVPERLLLLQLDPSFTQILGWRVALARAPGLGDPTHGMIRDDRFEFISNSGWDRVDDQGRFSQPPAATAPALWSIGLAEP
jgi:hypothetical protein